jgi:hypothetical protein
MATKKKQPEPVVDTGISFALSDEQRRAIEVLAGGGGVRISGCVVGDKVKIDVIAINAGHVYMGSTPFTVPGQAPFIACNAHPGFESHVEEDENNRTK